MPNYLGLTWPTLVDCTLTACQAGGVWKARVVSVVGHYSVQAENLRVVEITGVGPGGNTTNATFCDQLMELQAGSEGATRWWMLAATRTHERVHESHLLVNLDEATQGLQQSIELITVPAATAGSEAAAITQIKATREYNFFIDKAYEEWLKIAKSYGDNDHRSGVTRQAVRWSS